jgi:hypothetical protein
MQRFFHVNSDVFFEWGRVGEAGGSRAYDTLP